MKLAFTVPGAPVPCARPRVVSRGRGRKSRSFMPESTRLYETLVAGVAAAHVVHAKGWPHEAPGYRVVLRVFRAARRGDVDNFAKSLLDGMNGVVFVDDRLVTHLEVELLVDKVAPRAEVEVEALLELAPLTKAPRRATRPV